jgi:thermitase
MLKPVSVVGDVNLMPTDMTHGKAMAQTVLRAVSQQNTSGNSGGSKVRILSVVVYDSSGTTTSWNVALGVQAAVNHGATVLNLSLGGTADSAILDNVIQQALGQGIMIFAAAGNQPVNTPTYPAAIPGVNAVTALGSPGQLASYANYGSFVDMALPGTSVVYLGSQPYMVQGTSASTAYATGVAAGAKGINCLPWSQIQGAMQKRFPVP